MICSDPITGLNAPQTVFCLFYAIFWGLVANAQIRWKAFDWPPAFAGRRSEIKLAPSWKRLKRSICYLTCLPILLFLVLVAALNVPAPSTWWRLMVQLLAASVAALT